MWIFSTDGFFSAVQHNEQPNVLLIRSRCRTDLENLLAKIGGTAEIVELENADYRFRVFVDREDWQRYVSEAAASIDYPNFKNTIQDDDRHDAYMRVWAAMYQLQEKAVR